MPMDLHSVTKLLGRRFNRAAQSQTEPQTPQ